MLFVLDKNDGFVYCSCEKCGTEVKLAKSACEKVGTDYKISRSIKCFKCGEASHMVRNVVDIAKVRIHFDEELNRRRISDGVIMETYIGLVKWKDSNGNYHPSTLTFKNFNAEVTYIRRNVTNNFPIPANEELSITLTTNEYGNDTVRIQASVETALSIIINEDESGFKGIEVNEIVVNQYELIQSHFKILNDVIRRERKKDEAGRERVRQNKTSENLNLMINGVSLETSVGHVQWYDDEKEEYLSVFLVLNGFDAILTMTDGANSTTRITVKENGMYTISDKHQYFDSIEVFTSLDENVHRFIVNLYDNNNRYAHQEKLIEDHFHVLNEYFVKKQNNFNRTASEICGFLLENKEIAGILNNYIKKTDMLFWSNSYIVVFERLLNRNKIGQFTLICNDDELTHNLKYEKILDGNDDVNIDELSNYYENEFLKLSKILEKRSLAITEELSLFVTWKLLRKSFIDYYHDGFAREYGEYFIEVPKTVKDYVNVYGSIDTIDINTVGNAGRFTYFLIKQGVLQTDNYILGYSMLVDVLLEYIENKKVDDFEKSLISNASSFEHSYSIDDVDLMNGHEFEQFVALLFAKMGYSTQVTKGSGDQGVDVIAERNGRKFGIQAKCYANAITNKAIQEVVAGINHYKLDKAIVVTNNYFTDSARELAQSNGVVLWDRAILKEKIAEVF